MPSLSEQRLIIRGIERKTAIKRVRLIDALRTIDPPVDGAMVAGGTVLIVADLVPGFSAVAGLLTEGGGSRERRKRLWEVIHEAPYFVRSVSRLLGK